MNERSIKFRDQVRRAPSFALTGLLLLAGIYTFYFGRGVLLPVVLALLLSWILSPAVLGLKRLHLPAPLGAGIVVGAMVAAIGYGVASLAEPAGEWIDKAPTVLRQVDHKLRGVRESVTEVARITEKAEQITGQDGGAGKVVAVVPSSLFSRTLTATPAFVLSAISTVILAYLLLAYGGPLMRRLVRIMPSVEQKKATIQVARGFRADIARYLFVMTCLSVGLGVMTGVAMHWLGMPNPVLWAVLVAILNYVPYLGPVLSLIILTPVAILSIEPLHQALLVPAVFLVLNLVEGELLMPILIGKFFTLNPIIVFLSILFLGWLWGAVGALIAVPVLVSFRTFGTHVPALRPLSDLIAEGPGREKT